MPGEAVRRAAIDEAPAIAQVLRAAFAEHEALYTPAAYKATTPDAEQIRRRWLEGPVWVALAGAEIVDTASGARTGTGLCVRSMGLKPEARGQDPGRQLLEAAEWYAVQEGCRRLYLSTTPFLRRAIGLYERFGLTLIDAGRHDLHGTPLFTMAKPLP